MNLASLSGTFYSGSGQEQLMLQRDAIGSALDIFSGSNKLRKDVLSSWAPNQGYAVKELDLSELIMKPIPSSNFLDNIPSRYSYYDCVLSRT